MAVLYVEPYYQAFDNNGDPLAGGKIYTYSAGTTTPKATYTTAAGDVENTNPIILDSAGRAVIFVQGSYTPSRPYEQDARTCTNTSRGRPKESKQSIRGSIRHGEKGAI